MKFKGFRLWMIFVVLKCLQRGIYIYIYIDMMKVSVAYRWLLELLREGHMVWPWKAFWGINVTCYFKVNPLEIKWINLSNCMISCYLWPYNSSARIYHPIVLQDQAMWTKHAQKHVSKNMEYQLMHEETLGYQLGTTHLVASHACEGFMLAIVW